MKIHSAGYNFYTKSVKRGGKCNFGNERRKFAPVFPSSGTFPANYEHNLRPAALAAFVLRIHDLQDCEMASDAIIHLGVVRAGCISSALRCVEKFYSAGEFSREFSGRG